jgi:hypothetical protein
MANFKRSFIFLYFKFQFDEGVEDHSVLRLAKSDPNADR